MKSSRNPVGRPRRRVTALVAGAAVALAGVVPALPAAADTRPEDPTLPVTVSADALPAPQIDGVVWDQVVVGDTVYVAGSFSTARPAGARPGTSTVPRQNLLAFDLRTGELRTSWAPSTNGQVLAIEVSPDGSRLYIGGQFTQVNGATVWRIAALDRATGALIPSFVPKPDASVRAIAVTEDTVYFGGLFNAIGTEPRPRLAAVSPSGDLLPWAPEAVGGSGVNALIVSPDETSVVVGGSFTSLNGSNRPGYGLGAVDPVTGESLPFEANMQWIRNGGRNGAILHLSGDDDYVYGSGYTYGRSAGTLEGTFAARWDGGELVWVDDCHGDTYSAIPVGDVIYQASHKHYCGNQGAFHQTEPWTTRLATAVTKEVRGVVGTEPYDYTNFAGNPRPEQLNWYPEMDTGTYTGQSQGPWSVAAGGDYVVFGGEFLNVNGRPQQGLVRFATREVAPNEVGPQVTGGKFDLSATSEEAGTVRLRWTANYDWDNEHLTYSLIRNSNTASPIHEVVQASRFYRRPTMGYVDRNLTPGSTYRYRLRATDPWGNVAWSDTVTVVVSGAAPTEPGDYAQAVLASEPDAYWRFDESSESPAWLRDASGWDDLRVRGAGVTAGAAGAVDGGTALQLSGASTAYATTTPNDESPREFTVETWIRTTTTRGGRIIGWSTSDNGTSSYADRHLYMTNQGRIVLGVRPYSGSRVQLQSAAAYNDGQWHHVVGTSDASGTRLYVDGVRVADGAAVTGHMYGGYWRIGGDTLSGWTSRPSSDAFSGQVDDAAVYSRALSHAEVREHVRAAGRTVTVPTPADAYGADVAGLDPELYWRFDETSGTTAADSGPYGAPGTYRSGVTLGAAGALTGGVGRAASFDGSNDRVTSNRSWVSPRRYSTELWFSSTSRTGGTLLSFGNNQTSNATQYDRQVVLRADGTLAFSVYAGSAWTHVTSPGSYADGAWHHVVATQDPVDGMRLYVDGELVGTDPQTGNRSLTGYWKVGGDTSTLAPTFVAARVDEVAVYDRVLPAATVARHWALGSGEDVNLPPTASFEATVDDLGVTLDGSGSSDPDGTVATWAWDLGDGTTATGTQVTHVYDAAGTYTVTLTVTDDGGASDTVTQEVTVTEPPTGPVALDTFSRTDGSGWGTAEAGGTWSYLGSPADFTVVSGAGRVRVPTAGASRTALLAGVSERDVDVAATVALLGPVDGGGVFSSVLARRDGSTDYRAKVKVAANGAVTLYLVRTTGGETTLASGVVPGVVLTPGERLRVRLEVTGTEPTTLRAKAWETTTAEPTTWQLTATDSAEELQGRGGVGVLAYVSATATTLPVTFVVDDVVAVRPGDDQPLPENVPPTAEFDAAVDGRDVALDGSGSADPDGTITSWAWDLGDGSTATGAQVTHTYAAAGTYDVVLTVTDDAGATATATRQVQVTAPEPGPGGDEPGDDEPDPEPEPGGVLASDDFARQVTSGWGAAPTGGAWSLVGAVSSFAVADGQGRLTLGRPGAGLTAVLPEVSSTDTDVRATLATETLADAGGSFLSLIGRRVGSEDYRARVKIAPSGAVTLYLTRVSGGETTLGALSVPGVSFAQGDALRMRLEVTGTAPTTLRAKVWEVGQAEPADWQLTASDATASLQAPGGVGVMGYLSGTSTSAPVVVTVDDLVATHVGDPVPANQPPVPAFTSSVDGLTATFDASATTDPDGTVVLYGWDFGDGALGTGATTSRTYAAPGTYSVTLTATDDDGAAASVTHTVTVGGAEPPVGEPPVAAFTVDVDGPTVTVDGTGSSDPDGTVTAWAWDFGDGATASGPTASHTYEASGQYTVVLVATDDDGRTASASHVVDVTVPAAQEPVDGVLLADDFARTLGSGWGEAGTGGAWAVVGAASAFDVDGVGRMTLPRAGAGLTAHLPDVPLTDVDATATFVLPVRADGGGAFVSLVGRRVGAADYRAKVKVAANGQVTLYLVRTEGGETNLAVTTVPGLVVDPGEALHVRLQVVGTSPTTVRARVWDASQGEPTTWQLESTDGAAALQAPGSVGVGAYLAGSATTVPFVVEVDDLVARDPAAP